MAYTGRLGQDPDPLVANVVRKVNQRSVVIQSRRVC